MRTIEATIKLDAAELARLLSEGAMIDRHAAMVQKHGEACTKTTAAKIISCSFNTINAMLEDGRILPACGGERVDVRSLCDYIENRGERNREVRLTKRGHKKYV